MQQVEKLSQRPSLQAYLCSEPVLKEQLRLLTYGARESMCLVCSAVTPFNLMAVSTRFAANDVLCLCARGVCACIYMYVYVYIQIHIHILIRACTYTSTHA